MRRSCGSGGSVRLLDGAKIICHDPTSADEPTPEVGHQPSHDKEAPAAELGLRRIQTPEAAMVARWAGRKGRPWRELCAKVYADPDETRCIRCRQPVDKTLSIANAPAELRRYARSVDHIIAIELGGERLSRDNVGLAHFGCNSRHGAHVRWAKHKPGHKAPAQRMTTEW